MTPEETKAQLSGIEKVYHHLEKAKQILQEWKEEEKKLEGMIQRLVGNSSKQGEGTNEHSS